MKTVEFMIAESLDHINPFGCGCCLYHVSIEMLFESLSKLRARTCPSKYAPLLAWQCESCLALNGNESDSDDDCEESDAEDAAPKVRWNLMGPKRDP